MTKRILHAFLLIPVLCALLTAAAHAAGSRSLYEGRHFLLGFMQNEAYRFSSESFSLRMYIATKRPSRVRVTMPGGTFRSYTLKADDVLSILLDPALEVTRSEIPQLAAIEVTSDEPISVYALSSLTQSSDAYSVIPTDAWGFEHYALTMSNDQYNASESNPPRTELDSLLLKTPRLGEFMVIAAEDNTTVCYTPTAPTYAGIQPDNMSTVVLNKGECFLVKSAPARKDKNDLTGTYVTSDKPVGFLSGHMRTSIPHLDRFTDGIYDTKDHLIEMLPPVDSWGKNFVSAPYGSCSEGDYFRVMAAYDGTTLTMQNEFKTESYTLERGLFIEFENITVPTVWTADKPVLIGQYMYSDFVDRNTSADPCFVTLPPTEKFVRKLLFQAPYTNAESQFGVFATQIICTADALGSLKMDGKPIEEIAPEIQTQTVETTGMHWAVIPIVPEKTYKLQTTTGSLSGIIYAYGPQDSYSMPLGISPNIAEEDSLAPVITATGKCGSIKGSVRDPDPGSSGIFEVFIDEALSYNYKVIIDKISDNASKVIEFTADPIDLYTDAHLVLIATDRYGNESQFIYDYKAPSIAGTKTVELPRVGEGATVCAPVIFTNTGDSSVVVTGMYIMSDMRATIKGKPAFPLTLDPGKSIEVEVCYTATSDTAALRAQMLVRYGCDLQWWIPVGHTSSQPSISAIGFDFGGVLVGDTACARIAVVNTGNTPVTLSGLRDIANPDIFLVDTAGVFPHELAAGDTLWIKACFTPNARKEYESHPTASNSYRLPNSLDLKGHGVAPEIVVENIDWKQRRTGTQNDSVLTITNRGTHPAELNIAIPTTGPDSAFFYSPEKLFPLTLKPDSSVKLPVRFAPAKPVSYSTTVPVAVSWKYHPPVKAVLAGVGTLPTITTTDIVFDTLVVGTYADTTTTALTAGGNELLTVDSLFFVSGDIASFVIPNSSWKSRKVAIGATSPFTARFVPLRAGWHRARVAVVHDARDNYKRDTAYFELSGFAITNDITSVELSLQTSQSIYSCHTYPFTLVFDNTGSTLAFTIDSLAVEAFGTQTTVVLPPGTIAATGATIALPAFELSPTDGGVYAVVIRVYYRPLDREESSPRISTLTQNITVWRSQLSLAPAEAVREVVPWDKPSVDLRGEIAGGETLGGDFSIHVGYNLQSFRPMYDTTTLVFIHNNGQDTTRVRARVVEDNSGVIITPEPLGDIRLPARWYAALPLFVFLSPVELPALDVSVQTDGCLLGDSTRIPFRLTGVCSFDYRNVHYRPVVTVSIRPNPAAENAFVDISLPEDNTVSINIVDALGRSFVAAEKMYLKKGKYSYKLSFADYNSGLYSLVVMLSDSVSQHHFLINK